ETDVVEDEEAPRVAVEELIDAIELRERAGEITGLVDPLGLRVAGADLGRPRIVRIELSVHRQRSERRERHREERRENGALRSVEHLEASCSPGCTTSPRACASSSCPAAPSRWASARPTSTERWRSSTGRPRSHASSS